MKVHGTEIPAVVKQNNKGLPAADTVINQHRNIQGQAREREIRDETNNEVRTTEESLDSVKSEMEDIGGQVQVQAQAQAQAQMYRRNTMEMQHPGVGGGGYIMGVPGNVLPHRISSRSLQFLFRSTISSNTSLVPADSE